MNDTELIDRCRLKALLRNGYDLGLIQTMLFATDVVVPTSKWVSASDHRAKKTGDAWAKSGHRSAKVRSKTFPGIANAMSMQWEPK